MTESRGNTMEIADTDIDRLFGYLERIVVALETEAHKPAFVKTAEKRLESAEKILEEAIEAEVKDTNENKTVEAKPTNEEVDSSSIVIGVRVKVSSTDSRKDGVVGTIVKETKAWLQVETDDGKSIPVRRKECVLITTPSNSPPEEMLPEPVESTEDFAPSDDITAPENFVISGGIHNNKTVHTVFNESPRGKQFIIWLAKRGAKGPELTDAARKYLEQRGENWE